jgi:hypothetical protein
MEWSFQVRQCSTGEAADFYGVTMARLLTQSGAERIDLLKMDIEAAEQEVFSHANTEWLARTKNIAIELHDDDCIRSFKRAMASYIFHETSFGELTMCCNIALRSPASTIPHGVCTHD